jgi:hypothetical protein
MRNRNSGSFNLGSIYYRIIRYNLKPGANILNLQQNPAAGLLPK